MTDPNLPHVDQSQLTRMPQKWALYRREVYFRESFDDLAFVAEESNHRIADVLATTALLMVKPDGLAKGVLPEILDFLDEHGFVVASWSKILLQSKIWRELWRYQLTCATSERLIFNDILYEKPCVLLALRHPSIHDLPATVLLSKLKGSATLERQHSSSLRARLNQPNRMLSLFHVADEPADLVRELGVLIENSQARQNWFLGVTQSHHLRQELLVKEIEAETEPSPRAGLPTLVEARAAAANALRIAESTSDVNTLQALIDGNLRLTSSSNIRSLWERTDLVLDRWTVLILVTSAIYPDEPGESKVLDNPPVGAWGDGDLNLQ